RAGWNCTRLVLLGRTPRPALEHCEPSMPWSASSAPRRARDPVRENVPLAVRGAATLGVAVAGALLCALPAALRIAPGLPGDYAAARTELGLAAAALAPMLIAVLVLRRAGDGLRMLLAH